MNLGDALGLVLLQSTGTWLVLRNLGAMGLLIVGLTDGSIIPLPGAADALTIILSARNADGWFYYAITATTGSAIGGLFTYLFAYKRGQIVLQKRLGPSRTRRLSRVFARWGFFAVAVPAMLPIPVSPFLLTAGAMQYPKKRFLVALVCGRTAKFTLLAGFAALFGRRVLTDVLDRYQALVFWSVIGIVVASSAILYRLTTSGDYSDVPDRSEEEPIFFLDTDRSS
jgi:membrane protein YqaA with SNARE-associated domain